MSLFGAIELGGSKVLCAVGSSHEALEDELRIETRDPESTLRDVEQFFARHASKLAGLGIASFGPLELDPSRPRWGSMLATPKPGWSGAPLATRLMERFGVPVSIDTDVNAAALAEQRHGAARGMDPCAYITVGTGIGVGVVIDGRPLHGLLHPELGHAPALAACGFEGVCPFHGRCIEGVASAPALQKRSGRPPSALDDDDPVWALEAVYLAQLVMLCVLAYSPRRVVLGGGVLARTGLLSAVRSEVTRAMAGYVPRSELDDNGMESYLVAPEFGTRAGLVGAFLLAQRGAS
jgi:fructokinase